MRGKAICPGSCGEIVQGLVDGQNFLITCPIALYSEVTVQLAEKERFLTKTHNIKSYTAAQKVLEYFEVKNCTIKLHINSQIPRGVGLSSSTADITATCLATAKALKKTISPDTIADIALSIEPSDGIMYPGAWIFDHIYGRRREELGQIPDMDVYIINTGEHIDTLIFNNRHELKMLNINKEKQVKEALALAYEAFDREDKRLLGDAMIKSAISHQPILYKEHLFEIIALGKEFGAIGVNIAHSGSALGIFCEKEFEFPKQFWMKIKYIMDKYKKKYHILKTQIDNSGPRTVLI